MSFTSCAYAVVDGQSMRFADSAGATLIREHIVRLVHLEHGQFIFDCSGVLINDSTVVTAAHCQDPSIEKYWERGQVLVEFIGKNDDVKRLQVDRIGSEDSPRMDVLLLRLRGHTPWPFSLPLTQVDCDDSDEYIVAGYGVNATGGFGQELNIGVYHHYQKTSSFNFELVPTDAHICFGDSGSGIFCRQDGHLALVGVVNDFWLMASRGQNSHPQVCRDGLNLVATSVEALDFLEHTKR